jgi:hypothetical protein
LNRLAQERYFYSSVGEMEWKKGGAESIKEIAGDIIWNMAFHLIRRERKAESTLHLAFPRGNC